MAHKEQHIFPLVLLLAALSFGSVSAQEVYRATWTVQDKSWLRQDLAKRVIEAANDWLTRDNITNPTARLDDQLRITVAVDYLPETRKLHRKLIRLVMGTIVLEEDFENFLANSTIDSLVRPNCYWRDMKCQIVNPALWPYVLEDEDEFGTGRDDYDVAFNALETLPDKRIDINESSIKFGPDLRLWAGLGFEELGLPGLSYGKVRIGAAYQRMKFWGELPAPINTVGSRFFARGFDATVGVGLSFETDAFGGALTWSDPSGSFGTRAINGDTSYVLSRSALFYFPIPIGKSPVGDGYLRLKLGPGYMQTVGRVTRTDVPAFDLTDDRIKLFARMEYASANSDGTLKRSVATELFSELARHSVILSWNEQLSPRFGVHVTVQGVLGKRDPYLPGFSVMFSPTISF